MVKATRDGPCICVHEYKLKAPTSWCYAVRLVYLHLLMITIFFLKLMVVTCKLNVPSNFYIKNKKTRKLKIVFHLYKEY